MTRPKHGEPRTTDSTAPRRAPDAGGSTWLAHSRVTSTWEAWQLSTTEHLTTWHVDVVVQPTETRAAYRETFMVTHTATAGELDLAARVYAEVAGLAVDGEGLTR